MVAPNTFVASAVITGGVAPDFNQSVRAAVQGVNALGRSTEEMARDQRTFQNQIVRSQRNLRRLHEELDQTDDSTEGGRRSALALTRAIGTQNRTLSRASRSLGEVERAMRQAGVATDGTHLKTFNLRRQLRDQNQELAGVTRALRSVARGLDRSGRAAKTFGDEVSESGNRVQSAFRGVAIGAGAISAGIALAVRESIQQFDRLNMVRLDFPGLDAAGGRQFLQAADLVGLDEGRLADLFNELDIRVGEFVAGTNEQLGDLGALGVNIAPLLGIEDSRERAFALIDALAQIPDAAQRAAAADIAFGGSAGQAANLLTQDAERLLALKTALSSQPAFNADDLRTLEQTRQSIVGVRQSADDLRDAFTIALAPAIGDLSGRLEGALDATSQWLAQNQTAAPIIAGTAFAVTGLAGAVSAGAGFFGDMGASVFFAAQGWGTLAAAGGRLTPIMAGAKVAALGVAGGIRAVTVASIGFIATPVGAAIVGITLAVGALAAGAIYLADKVGGFGNLAGIVFAGAKVAALEFVNALIFNFRLVAPVLDAIIGGVDAVNRALGRGGIDFRVGTAIAAFDEVRANARADLRERVSSGLAEGQAQAQAGGGFGRSLGFNRGGGDIAALPPAPSAPRLASAPSGAPAQLAPSAASAAPTTAYSTVSGVSVTINLPNVRDAGDLGSEDAQRRIADDISTAIARGAR